MTPAVMLQLARAIARRIDVIVRESEAAACAVAETLYDGSDGDEGEASRAQRAVTGVTLALQQFDILLQRTSFFTALQRRLLDGEATPFDLGALLRACPWETDQAWLRNAWSDVGAEACA